MFEPNNLEEAKGHVVGDCNGIPTKLRWENETPYMVKIITDEINKRGSKTVLDYGCGAGRIAKGVVEQNRGVKLIGMDKSDQMLKIAKDYVLSERFIPIKIGTTQPEKVDFAYAIYVLQHIHAIDLRETLAFLAMSSDSLFVVNSICRMAVTLDGRGFHEDGINMINEVRRFFPKINWGIPFQYIAENPVMRKMFLEGQTLHWGALCEK